ncbi:hypothetical protein GCM10011610_25920 [Nocardia rhizosphaerihabitans]|uniref:Uncharacterized protein n=1 Tax=Nocardia rhizosphaerihabitans TaxID=1691570 RepID=A0ABQ2KDZ2_9NOCA|nr:hypothetical protein GCM10011610_25920 [Nocardia rhizosphaerihabitans]
MIADAKQLNAWLRAQMPALDETRYQPWNSGIPTSTSMVTLIHLRVQTPSTPDRTTTVVLVAHPSPTDGTEHVAGPADSRPACLPHPTPPHPGRPRPSVFRSPRAWRTRRSRPGS